MEMDNRTRMASSSCHKHRLALMNWLVSQQRKIVMLSARPGSLRETHFQLAKLIATMECGCVHELEFGSMSTMQLFTARFGFLDPFRGGVVGGGGVGRGGE